MVHDRPNNSLHPRCSRARGERSRGMVHCHGVDSCAATCQTQSQGGAPRCLSLTIDMFGYHGRALIIDLSTARHREVPLPEVSLRRVIGGVGLGAWLLYEHARPGCDPRGPENALVLASSPLLGTGLTTATKFALVTKSPQTGFITDSLSSSDFAHHLKRSGYDAIVLTGQAPEWSVLWIDADGPRLASAERL